MNHNDLKKAKDAAYEESLRLISIYDSLPDSTPRADLARALARAEEAYALCERMAHSLLYWTE